MRSGFARKGGHDADRIPHGRCAARPVVLIDRRILPAIGVRPERRDKGIARNVRARSARLADIALLTHARI